MFTTIEVKHPSHVSDDMLACKVCLDHYNSSEQRPRALHCNHTFCERCIDEHLQQRNKIICPLCRTRTRFKFKGPQSNGVHCLPVNVTAVSLDKQRRQALETPGQTYDEGLTRNVHKIAAQRVSRLHPSPNGEDLRVITQLDHTSSGLGDRADDSQTNATFSQLREQMTRGLNAISNPDRHAAVSVTRDLVLPGAAAEDATVVTPLEASAVYVSRFGKYHDAAAPGQACKPGTFLRPSHIAFLASSQARGGSGRLAVLDMASSSVQLFTDYGEFLSLISVDGARAACFVVPADGSDIVERHRVAIATNHGVSLFDQLGRLEKTIPIADVVLALAGYQSGFIAAHSNRLTICGRLSPAVSMSTIGSLVRRQYNRPSSTVHFRGIVDVAVYVSRYRDATGGNGTSIYVLDVDTIYVVDPATSGLRGVVCLPKGDVIGAPTGPVTPSPHPVSIAVDPTSGHVIVSDSGERRVSAYQCGFGEDESGTEGRPVRLLVQLGATMSTIENCGHVTVGAGGLLYVVVCGSGVAEIRIYRM